MIDKGLCDKGFIWNTSNCDCECDKSCDIGEYLDYENCKCRKKLVERLIEECTENVGETRLVKKTTAKNENKHKYSSCTVYIVLFLIILTINVGIGTSLFTMNIWIVIKKMFLNMIRPIKQQCKWEKSKK